MYKGEEERKDQLWFDASDSRKNDANRCSPEIEQAPQISSSHPAFYWVVPEDSPHNQFPALLEDDA